MSFKRFLSTASLVCTALFASANGFAIDYVQNALARENISLMASGTALSTPTKTAITITVTSPTLPRAISKTPK